MAAIATTSPLRTTRSISTNPIARVLRRPLTAGLLLLAVYAALAFANDPHGYLGTDTGGKVATLRMMKERGRLDPDLGYWAERWDPDGRLHPLYYTAHIGSRWVNVTTLPALYVGFPLYRLGGYRLALLVPMLGAVAAAFAARALARRINAVHAWRAFWIVGLASPIAIYALDFWEHTLGVALMAWATVALLDCIDGGGRRGALIAGALFGLAATMRTEALVYAAVAASGACFVLLVRRRDPVLAAVVGVVFVVAMAVPLLANAALERATLGGSLRSQRAVAAAESSRSDAAQRAKEGVLTFTGLTASLARSTYVTGLCLLGLLVVAGLGAAAPRGVRVAAVALAGAALLYVTRFAQGLGYVPGLIPTTPLAALALTQGWQGRARRVTMLALAALPLVWALQYTGGAAPQWGGRYLLASGLLLGVVGVVALDRLAPVARATLIAFAVVVTVFGVAWTSVRTHDIARASRALTHRHERALVFREAHLAREAGGFYARDRKWLTAVTPEDTRAAFRVFEAAGVDTVGVVSIENARPDGEVAGWRAVARTHTRLFSDVDLRVTTYVARQ